MANPLLFISHKHTDHAIAEVIAKFIRDQSRGEVEVFLSSDPKFKGPRFGPELNAQLRQTLWNTDALILVYTSADDQDWSYCMWESGAAAQPNTPPTTCIVFQCWRDVPKPFADNMRVNARLLPDLQRFTNQLMTDPTFFPRRGQALAPQVKPETIDKAAKEFLKELEEVLPNLDDGSIQQWAAWPYLRIELPMAQVEALKAEPEAQRAKLAQKLIIEHGVVIEGGDRAAELFGLANLAPRHAFKEILKTWVERVKEAEPAWFSSCCEQIAAAALRQFPVIRPAVLKSANDEANYTPVLSRTRRLPFAKVTQFDINFYNLADLRAMPVASRMLSINEVYFKNIGQTGPETIRLVALMDELESRGKNRIPLLDAQLRPCYIVHSSMIDRFLVKQTRAGATSEKLNALTLADLLAEPGMKEIFETTFAVIDAQATLADARKALENVPDGRDIFVTAGGGRNDPTLGWLTNIDLFTKR